MVAAQQLEPDAARGRDGDRGGESYARPRAGRARRRSLLIASTVVLGVAAGGGALAVLQLLA